MPRRRTGGALQALQNDSSYSQRSVERLDWTYHDTAVLAAATLTHNLFTVPLGQANKNRADTNLPNASQLPQGQNFKIHAIKARFVSSAARNTAAVQLIYDVLNNTTMRVIVPGKDSLGEWVLAEIFGISSLVALTPTAAGDNIPLISPDFKGIYPLNFPLKIGATQTFKIELQHHVAVNAALAGDKIVVMLNGRLDRMA